MALDTRAAAAGAVAEVLAGRSLNQALPPLLDRVAPRDRGLLQQLSYGTLRQGPRLTAVLDLLLDSPLKDRDRDVKALILVGLYQLQDTRIPDHAAVSATVAATRVLRKNWARGLCNAVLRRFLRERDQLLGQLHEAAAAAHPPWLYRAIGAQWPERAAQIIAANNSQPPMTLRVNSLRSDRESYLAKLAAAGIDARPGALSPEAIYLEQPRDVTELPGFLDGEVSVQDEAAQLAAQLLHCGPGDRVLDACAAPGGKSCHLLERYPQLDELVAADLDPLRLARLEQNLERLELSASLVAMDATAPPGELAAESFQRILADAPCSASGVIRRHPDVKLLRRADDIPALAAQQLAILRGLWPLLAPGGQLLYATCSLLEEENAAVVAAFVQATDSARLAAMDVDWGEPSFCGRQLLPGDQGPDGLYYALLEKA